MNKATYKHRLDNSPLRAPVAISAAHVYLTPGVIEQLFCDRYRLHEHSRLLQPTQYAAKECVTLNRRSGAQVG